MLKYVQKFFKGLILSVLVAILFTSTLFTLILIPICNIVNKNTIKDTIASINIESLILNNSQVEKQINNLLEPVYTEAAKYGISNETIIKIVDSKELKGFLGNVSGNITDYVITGESKTLISESDVKNIVSKTIDDINASGYYEIESADKDNILKVVSKEYKKYEKYLPNTELLEKELDTKTLESLNIIRFILSSKFQNYLLIFFGGAFIGICLIKWQKARWINWNSVTIFGASFFITIASIILLLLNNFILKDKVIYIHTLLKSPLQLSLIIALILDILMVGTLVSYKLISKKHNKKSEN